MKLALSLLVFLAFASLGASCTKEAPVKPPVPPLEAGDSGDEDPVTLGTPCGKACANLRKLGCPEGNATLQGSRCYDVCRNAASLVRPECVSEAKDVAALRACNVRCAK